VYLLDTNIVSELRRPKPHGGLVAWLDGVADHDLHLSAVTLGELQAGAEMTRDQDPAKAREIEAWLEQVAQTYNVIPMDAAVLRLWAKLMHHKSDTLVMDAMIAATAMSHDLTVVTRNVGDFKVFRSKVFNPFERR
jgi:predicted nucleic acid-binding protein